MKNFTIITGLNDKDTKRQIISTTQAEKRIAGIILLYTGGATLTRCKGIYTHNDNGTTVYENSIKAELSGIDTETALKIARDIKTALNQESIYFAVTDAEIDFI